jgi:hypothetical protein
MNCIYGICNNYCSGQFIVEISACIGVTTFAQKVEYQEQQVHLHHGRVMAVVWESLAKVHASESPDGQQPHRLVSL